MLSNEHLFVLKLLRYSFDATHVPDVPDSLDIAHVANAIRANGILLTVYPSTSVLSQLQQALLQDYYALVSQAVNQNHEGERVLEKLSNAGMRCIALKGWEMRQYYPQKLMRQMVDVDILVNPFSYPDVKRVMMTLGYKGNDVESLHIHDSFIKGSVNIELHKRLYDSQVYTREHEKRMWSRAMCVQGNVWHMTDEDYCVFHFAHMYRDFRKGTLGLRRIVDTWLLNNRMEDLDRAYVSAELETMGIHLFAQRMIWLGKVCMGEEPMDEEAELLLNHAFSFGIKGTGWSHKMGKAVIFSSGGLASGRINIWIKTLFPSYESMSEQYEMLRTYPILLPLYWAKRITHYLLDGSAFSFRRSMSFENVTEEDFEYMRHVLRTGGCKEGVSAVSRAK